MQIQLLLTGNEIMSGDTVDSNSAAMAEYLGAKGWSVFRKITVPDDMQQLCDEIRSAAASADLLIINGGLGPTVDDLTSEALARVNNTELCEHPDALAHLEKWCGQRKIEMNAANYKQALLPADADIISNSIGSAVGIKVKVGNCLVCATPGVPSEMHRMMQNEIIPMLLENFTSDQVEVRRLGCFGIGESTLQNLISQQLPDWPSSIDLGFRASVPILEVKLTATTAEGRSQLNHWQTAVQNLLGDSFIGDAPCSLADGLINALRAKNWRACTAESCTGGLIASQITEIAGASDVFQGGFVTYSNSMKANVLQVPEQTLEKHGAVSCETASAMLRGALTNSQSDVGIAVTGIAGPGGGTEDKPVGTVCIAWGSLTDLHVRQFQLPFPRKQFQLFVTAFGLDLLRRNVANLEAEPHYLKRYR